MKIWPIVYIIIGTSTLVYAENQTVKVIDKKLCEDAIIRLETYIAGSGVIGCEEEAKKAQAVCRSLVTSPAAKLRDAYNTLDCEAYAGTPPVPNSQKELEGGYEALCETYGTGSAVLGGDGSSTAQKINKQRMTYVKALCALRGNDSNPACSQ